MTTAVRSSPARRNWQQRLVIGVGVTVTALCVFAASAVGYAYLRFGQITRYDVDLDAVAEGDPRNFLLVGSDSRENLDPSDIDYGGFVDATSPTGGKRTDTIMILRVDPDEESADLLSLPRDLYVPIGGPDGRRDRINAAYGDGRQALIDTIQHSLGIPIHHYVEVDFAGFKDVVAAVGGVDLYVERPMRDDHTGLDLETVGCQRLDAVQALAFVRSRHLEFQRDDGRWATDPSADLGRISRQQLFIRQAIARAVDKGLTNPVTLNELVNVGIANVGLDPGLDASDLLAFGRRFASFDERTLRTHTVETSGFRTSGGAAVLQLEEEASEPVLNIFRGLPPDAVSVKFIDVAVLNGTGTESQATDVAAALGQLGFGIGEIGDTAEPFPQTALYYAPGSESAALRVVRHLTSLAQLVEDPELDRNEVVLVTGPDFTTVHEQPSPDDLSTLLPGAEPTSTTVAGSAETTTTTTSVDTTTTVGFTPEPPPGIAC